MTYGVLISIYFQYHPEYTPDTKFTNGLDNYILDIGTEHIMSSRLLSSKTSKNEKIKLNVFVIPVIYFDLIIISLKRYCKMCAYKIGYIRIQNDLSILSKPRRWNKI